MTKLLANEDANYRYTLYELYPLRQLLNYPRLNQWEPGTDIQDPATTSHPILSWSTLWSVNHRVVRCRWGLAGDEVGSTRSENDRDWLWELIVRISIYYIVYIKCLHSSRPIKRTIISGIWLCIFLLKSPDYMLGVKMGGFY